MLLGLAYHATFSYVPGIGPYYPVVDLASSPFMASLGDFLHAFRMEVFFALSGFFSALVLERRGADGFIRERAKRVLGPFAVALPVTLWADQLTRSVSASHGTMAQTYQWGTGLRAMPLHLWFLEYLFMFCLATWAIARVAPRVLVGATTLVRRALATPPVLLLATVPTVLIALQHPELRPDSSFLPEWQSVVHHGLFFALGLLLWGARDAADPLKQWGGVLASTGLLVAAWVAWGPLQWQVTGQVLSAVAAWAVTLGLVGIGLRPTAAKPFVRTLVEAAYWVYLAHYPLVVALQVASAKLAAPVALKYSLVVALTFAVCLGTFRGVIRRSALGPYLGARR